LRTYGTGPRPPKSPNPIPPAPSRIRSRRDTPESLSPFLCVTAGPTLPGQGYCRSRHFSSPGFYFAATMAVITRSDTPAFFSATSSVAARL
jgi:hypothetical protein